MNLVTEVKVMVILAIDKENYYFFIALMKRILSFAIIQTLLNRTLPYNRTHARSFGPF